MVTERKILAIVPARGGSKRLPRKNILELNGKPLIAWSIKAGLESKYVDKVIVSTDDEEIADIAQQYGADVPFIRPGELATDESTTVDVVLHAIKELALRDETYDYILLLQPTSPLRTAQHIDEAIDLMRGRDSDGVVSVCPVGHPVEWANSLPPDGSMDGFFKEEYINKRSQDFPEQYLINGAIYVVKTSRFCEEGTFLIRTGLTAYIMQRRDSIDVDTVDDLEIMRCLLAKANISAA